MFGTSSYSAPAYGTILNQGALESLLFRAIDYKVKTGQSETRLLEYTVVFDSGLTKDVSYSISISHTEARAAQYKIKAPVSNTKDVKYTLFSSDSVSKEFKYFIRLVYGEQRSLRYEIILPPIPDRIPKGRLIRIIPRGY